MVLQLILLLLAALRAVQTQRQYIGYSESDSEVFAAQRRHIAPMGVKFGMEESTPPRQISPQSVQQ